MELFIKKTSINGAARGGTTFRRKQVYLDKKNTLEEIEKMEGNVDSEAAAAVHTGTRTVTTGMHARARSRRNNSFMGMTHAR